MIKKPKFNAGDEVYYFYDQRVCLGIISDAGDFVSLIAISEVCERGMYNHFIARTKEKLAEQVKNYILNSEYPHLLNNK